MPRTALALDPSRPRLHSTRHTKQGTLTFSSQHAGSRDRRIRIQSHPWLHSKFEDKLGYMRPCLKRKGNPGQQLVEPVSTAPHSVPETGWTCGPGHCWTVNTKHRASEEALTVVAMGCWSLKPSSLLYRTPGRASVFCCVVLGMLHP